MGELRAAVGKTVFNKTLNLVAGSGDHTITSCTEKIINSKNGINMKRLSKSMVVCIMAAVMVMSVGCDKEK